MKGKKGKPSGLALKYGSLQNLLIPIVIMLSEWHNQLFPNDLSSYFLRQSNSATRTLLSNLHRGYGGCQH